MDAAKVYYVEGFFLTHGSEATLELSKRSSEASKVSNSFDQSDCASLTPM